jgi:hypothetical protein
MVSPPPAATTAEARLDKVADATQKKVEAKNASSTFSNVSKDRKSMPASPPGGVQECPSKGANTLTVPEIDRRLKINGNRQREVEDERARLLKEKGEAETYINNLQGYSGDDGVGDGPLREARIAKARERHCEIYRKVKELGEETDLLDRQRLALEEVKNRKTFEAELARRAAKKAEAERSERLRKGFPEEPQFPEDQVEESTMHHNVPGLVPRSSRS